MKTTMRFVMVVVALMLASAMAKAAEPMKPIPPIGEVGSNEITPFWGDEITADQPKAPAPKANKKKSEAPPRKTQTVADVFGQIVTMFIQAAKELPETYNGPEGTWPKPGNPNAALSPNRKLAGSDGAGSLYCNNCK